MMPGKHHPFTRPAIDEEGREFLRNHLRKAAKKRIPRPKIKEKRLIGGKWTRDYDESQPAPIPS